MSERKFKIWLNSGAGIYSKYEVTYTLDELGLTDDGWDAMNDEEKDDFMREIAFEKSDWGYQEIEGAK